MKKTVKQKWVKALKSGNYKQTRNALARKYKGQTRYCCLGVLCSLYAETKGGVKFEKPKASTNGALEMEKTAVLPSVVRQWAGLQASDPAVKFVGSSGYESYHNLSILNDEQKLNFNKIADLIDKNL